MGNPIYFGKYTGLEIHAMIQSGKMVIGRKTKARIRFWRDIDVNGPEHPIIGRCWIWLKGHLSKKCPYGQITVNRKNVRVHRFSWVLHNGPIADNLSVLHKCDNPLCANPDHLFLGSQKDNQEDMVNKGRSNKGEDRPASKLKEDDVRSIKERYIPKHPSFGQRALARKYGVSQAAIHYIVTERNWRYLP